MLKNRKTVIVLRSVGEAHKTHAPCSQDAPLPYPYPGLFKKTTVKIQVGVISSDRGLISGRIQSSPTIAIFINCHCLIQDAPKNNRGHLVNKC